MNLGIVCIARFNPGTVVSEKEGYEKGNHALQYNLVMQRKTCKTCHFYTHISTDQYKHINLAGKK